MGYSCALYVQAAIKSAIDSSIRVSGAAVPVVSNPYEEQALPYIVINQIGENNADTINTSERWYDVTIDVYTGDYKTAGTVTNKDIRRQIINALHRASLSISNCAFRGCLFDSSPPEFIEPDGNTVHGQCRFRIHVDTLT